MNKGVKFRIYPNKIQKDLINRTFGCCRLIYNRGLAMRKEAFDTGSPIGYTQTSAMLTELKHSEEFCFFKEVDFPIIYSISKKGGLQYENIYYIQC